MGTRLATSEESPLAAATKSAIVNSREDETIYRSQIMPINNTYAGLWAFSCEKEACLSTQLRERSLSKHAAARKKLL